MKRLRNIFGWTMDWNRKLAQKWLVRSLLITLITWFGGPTPGAAQDTGNAASNPPIVYVSNGGGAITEVNTTNNSVITTPPICEGESDGYLTPALAVANANFLVGASPCELHVAPQCVP